MAMQWQTVERNITGGMNNHISDRNTPDGQFTNLENGEYVYGDSLLKRAGYENVSLSGTTGTPLGITSAQGKLFLQTTTGIYVGDASANIATAPNPAWKGLFYAGYGESKTFSAINTTINTQRFTCSAFAGNYLYVFGAADVSALSTAPYLFCRVFEFRNNEFIPIFFPVAIAQTAAFASTGYTIKCFSTGSSVFVFYISSAGALTCAEAVYNGTTFTATTKWTTNTIYGSDYMFDCISESGGSTGFLAFRTNANDYRVCRFDGTGLSGTFTRTVTPADPPETSITIAITLDLARVYVSYFADVAGTKTVIVDCFTNSSSLPVSFQDYQGVDTVTTPVSLTACGYGPTTTPYDGEIALAVCETVDDENHISVYSVINTAGTPSRSLGNLILGMSIAGRIFVGADNNALHLFCEIADSVRGGIFLQPLGLGLAAGLSTPIYSKAGYGTTTNSHYVADIAYSANKFVALPYQSIGRAYSANNFTTAINLLTYIFDVSTGAGAIDRRIDSAPDMLGTSYLLTSDLMVWDGAIIRSATYAYDPVTPVATPSGVGTNLYSYKYCFAYTDASGRVFRSAPSLAGTCSTTSPNVDNVDVDVKSYHVIDFASVSMQIELYRTQANGTTHYFVTAVSNEAITSTYITITDSASDDTIAGNIVLYTDTGELANTPLPSPQYIQRSGNRLFATVNGNELWATKLDSDTNCPAFAAELIQTSLPGLDEMTALGVVNENLLIFSDHSIAVIAPGGPNNAGVGEFSAPLIISADIGCDLPGTVQETELGCHFQDSNRGIFLIGRGLQVENIGLPIDGTTSVAGVTCWTASVVRRSLVMTADPDFFTHPVFDIDNKVWMLRRTPATVSASPAGIVSATSVNDVHYIVTESGLVGQEYTGVYYDFASANPVIQTLDTGWLHLAGMQGFERIRRVALLMKSIATHRLTVTFYKNYEASSFQTETILSTSITGEPYQLRIRADVQKIEAIRIVIADSFSGISPSAGFQLYGITIEVGGKSGIMRLDATRTL